MTTNSLSSRENLEASEVNFYIPTPDLNEKDSPTIDTYWDWVWRYLRKPRVIVPLFDGPLGWTLQTYLYLKRAGFPCKLATSFPDKGIVISHSHFLKTHYKPSPEIYLVEIIGDRFLKCIYANFVITQNDMDPISKGILYQWGIIKSASITYWPQPDLHPRKIERGDRFENIGYMGNDEQLHPDLHHFEYELRKIDLFWMKRTKERFNDYSDIDAVVALRPNPSYSYPKKPATKLYNAWQAGVPAILGPEIAYQKLRKNELDYLEASNASEIFNHLKRLQRDLAFRKAMVENGKQRAKEFEPEVITEKWKSVIQNKILPQYTRWLESPFKRFCFIQTRRAFLLIPRLFKQAMNPQQ